MTKLAVLSDIHGNLDALIAVLERADSLGVDWFIILGDMVGYYFDGNEVLERIQELPASVISGNHEKLLLDCLESKNLFKHYTEKYGRSFEHLIGKLSKTTLRWLNELPESISIEYDKICFHLCHGAPWDTDAYIYPDANRDVFERCARKDTNFTLLGHTHYALMRRISKEQIVLNPGSVGQARDVSGFASWCFIDTKISEIMFLRTPYPQEKLLEKCQLFDPKNHYIKTVLTRTML